MFTGSSIQLLCLGTHSPDPMWGEVPHYASAEGVCSPGMEETRGQGRACSLQLLPLQLWHHPDFAMALPSAKHLTNGNPCQSAQGPVGIAQC